MATSARALLREGDVTPIGRVATGSLLWRTHGRLHLTVIVKATYAFRLRGRMLVRDPNPVVAVDEPFRGPESRAVRVPSDAVPYLGQADVTLVGHAYPPKGEVRSTSSARLALTSAEPLLYKTLYVYGDRTLLSSGPTPPASFERMPLVWERAVRGRDGANPVGRMAEVGKPLPNIVDSEDPEIPACFGPLPRNLPSARATTPGAPAERQSSILEIPHGFDWRSLQAAPLDQRIPYPSGDEWLLLEGLDPEQWRVQTRLPGGAAEAWVWSARGPAAAGHSVKMNADSLFIDADAGICTQCWRGAFALQSEQMLDGLHIAAGVSYPDQAIDWPAEIAKVEQAFGPPSRSGTIIVDEMGQLEAAPAPPPADVPLDKTVALGALGASFPAAKPLAPSPSRAEAFVSSVTGEKTAERAAVQSPPEPPVADVWRAVSPSPPSAPASAASPPGPPAAAPAPPASSAVPAPPPPSGRSPSPAAPASPPPPAPPQSPRGAAPGRAAASDPFEQTLSVDSDFEASLAAPFAVAPAMAQRAVLRPVAVPGAPWSAEPERPVRVPTGDPFEATLPVPELQPPSTDAAARDESAWRARVASDSPAAPGGPPAAPPPISPVEADVWRAVKPQVAVKRRRDDPFERTLDAPDSVPQGLGAPFSVPQADDATAPRETVSVPGAPWAHEPARPVRLPSGDPFEQTLAIDDVRVPEADLASSGAGDEPPAVGLGQAFLAAMKAANPQC